MSESFDLLAYAAQRRYRVRNLHDGRPVPPTRSPHQGRRGRFGGCRSAADREDAIIGRYGYVADDGNGRLGWCLLMRSRRALTTRLPQLRALGATVRQEGDTEAAGSARVEDIDEVARLIQPSRIARRPGSLANLAGCKPPVRGPLLAPDERKSLGGYLGSAGAGNGPKPV